MSRPAVDLLIAAATPEEQRALQALPLDPLSPPNTFRHRPTDQTWYALRTGFGSKRAARSAELLLREGPRFRHVLLIGFVGALAPELQPLDTIMGPVTDGRAKIFEQRYRPRVPVGQGDRGGITLSQPKFLGSPATRREARLREEWIATEMEHAAFLRPLLEADPGLTYEHLGLVSDSVDERIPSAIPGMLRSLKIPPPPKWRQRMHNVSRALAERLVQWAKDWEQNEKTAG